MAAVIAGRSTVTIVVAVRLPVVVARAVVTIEAVRVLRSTVTTAGATAVRARGVRSPVGGTIVVGSRVRRSTGTIVPVAVRVRRIGRTGPSVRIGLPGTSVGPAGRRMAIGTIVVGRVPRST
ncbi:hypothetical protein, partial [Embleya sp. NPDC059237]|uniref:hypothetical protein n=1 Tax=Embleya sp. NPDC059237 TaxID=3346784 RepID=UPI0036A19035